MSVEVGFGEGATEGDGDKRDVGEVKGASDGVRVHVLVVEGAKVRDGGGVMVAEGVVLGGDDVPSTVSKAIFAVRRKMSPMPDR